VKPEEVPSNAAGWSARLAEIFARASRPERRQALEELAEELVHQDPEQAADIARRILREKGDASGEGYDFVSAFMSRFAALDPAAAARWADFLPQALKFGASTPVAQQWAVNDWPAATRWAQGIDDVSLRTSGLRRVGEQLIAAGLTDAAPQMSWSSRSP
jgi:hypothetical protein